MLCCAATNAQQHFSCGMEKIVDENLIDSELCNLQLCHLALRGSVCLN